MPEDLSFDRSRNSAPRHRRPFLTYPQLCTTLWTENFLRGFYGRRCLVLLLGGNAASRRLCTDGGHRVIRPGDRPGHCLPRRVPSTVARTTSPDVSTTSLSRATPRTCTDVLVHSVHRTDVLRLHIVISGHATTSPTGAHLPGFAPQGRPARLTPVGRMEAVTGEVPGGS